MENNLVIAYKQFSLEMSRHKLSPMENQTYRRLEQTASDNCRYSKGEPKTWLSIMKTKKIKENKHEFIISAFNLLLLYWYKLSRVLTFAGINFRDPLGPKLTFASIKFRERQKNHEIAQDYTRESLYL